MYSSRGHTCFSNIIFISSLPLWFIMSTGEQGLVQRAPGRQGCSSRAAQHRHTAAQRAASNTPAPLSTREDQEDSAFLNLAADWKWWLITVWWSEDVKKGSHCCSISISHYFISVYLAGKGLQYLPTYKPTLHPEENRIMIILKITNKSYLTFKVNYCIIRRQCSKLSNSVISQTTAKSKTFIKATTAITVHTTFLGWLKDLALCLLCCIQFLVSSSRVGVQQHSAQAFVCSHCTALSSCCLPLEQLLQFCSSCKTTHVYIYPQEKKPL